MTALCGGGSSAPKSGIGGVLTIGAAAIEVFITSVLGLPELAPVLAPIIAGLVDIEIAAYCGTDPPADPMLTAGDLASALEFPASAATFAAQQKIVQWFESQYWYSICQCSVGSTPAPSTPSNPGQVTHNGGVPQGPSQCWSVTVPYQVDGGTLSSFQFTDLTAAALPAGVVTPITLTTSPLLVAPAVKLPAGVTNINLTATLNEHITNTSGQNVLVTFRAYSSPTLEDAANTIAVSFDHFSTAGQALNSSLPSYSTSTDVFAVFVQAEDNTAHSGVVTISFDCAPGTSIPQPCNCTDPVLEGELNQILQYVQAIYAGLPIPPSSFAEGTAHSGLTGVGSITFSGVPIALKVTLTTIPAWVGSDVSSPTFYFDVGFLSFGTSEGNYAQTRLELQDQVVTVPVLAGSVGYTLRNGVVATVTELLPGP